jgi:hypothetical protein
MLAELDYGLFEGKSRACAEKLGYTREVITETTTTTI